MAKGELECIASYGTKELGEIYKKLCHFQREELKAVPRSCREEAKDNLCIAVHAMEKIMKCFAYKEFFDKQLSGDIAMLNEITEVVMDPTEETEDTKIS